MPVLFLLAQLQVDLGVSDVMIQNLKKLAVAFSFGVSALVAVVPTAAFAEDMAPNAMVEKVMNEVLHEIKTNSGVQSGNINAATEAVDRVVMPHIDFARMTAAAVGPAWRSATPEQRKEVIDAFKSMLIRTYADSFHNVGDLKVQVLPMREQSDPKDVLVRSQVIGADQPIQLDYRLEKTPGQGFGWKVYNVNVLGAWIVNSYRTQFQPVINSGGIEGLIQSLRNTGSGNK